MNLQESCPWSKYDFMETSNHNKDATYQRSCLSSIFGFIDIRFKQMLMKKCTTLKKITLRKNMCSQKIVKKNIYK
jgi:hypothetical protein